MIGTLDQKIFEFLLNMGFIFQCSAPCIAILIIMYFIRYANRSVSSSQQEFDMEFDTFKKENQLRLERKSDSVSYDAEVEDEPQKTEPQNKSSSFLCPYCDSINPVGKNSCVSCGAPLGRHQP